MESQVEEDMLELTLTRYLADPARTSVQEQFSGGDTVGICGYISILFQ